ncbi:DUF4270 family protein [Larkinella terrae]|uniref:DUF4270 family protein n=1 Tax=Larkinella terrae TaxID=2025311 RepID=A0A7K0EKP0_9BACT|nr:DUF4270 family protein [Larkinella terrae]MRS62377.1 DUF4270 family protein [Larkinella terrae]
MRTLPRFFALPILVGIICSACMSGDLDVGQNVVKPDEMQLQYIDTVTVNLSTIMVPDSFITSSDSSVLVGRWNDSQTGLMSARGFASLSYVSNDLPDQKGIRFDSLVLELVHAYSVGDTLSPFTLQVHQLQKPLEIGPVHYNTQAVAYNTSPLLQTTVVPQFKEEIRQIRLRIPETLAKTFYDKLISKEINSAETMSDFWKGMAFLSSSTNNVFLGLNLTSSLSGIRLYYRGNDISQTNYNLLFPFQASQFTQLTNNRTGTPLQALKVQSDAVSSRSTQNASFVVPGAFLSTRIEIPSLTEFIKPENFIGLNLAELIIEPVRKDVRDNAPPPSNLGLYFTNNQNETTEAVPGTSTGATSAVAAYTFLPNAIELEDAYVFNITHYINQVIKGQAVNRPMLLRVPVGQSTMKTMLQRAMLGNRQNATDRIRLKLYVTSDT